MTTTSKGGETGLDYKTIFHASPTPFLLLEPDNNFVIFDVNHSYMNVTHRKYEELVGQKLFDAFPEDPSDPTGDGVKNLNASLHRVLQNKRADVMPIQKYDIPSAKDPNQFEERHWSPINTPVLNDKKEIICIIHRVEDVTTFVLAQKKEDQQSKFIQGLESRTEQLLAELFSKDQERIRALESAREESKKRADEAEVFRRKQAEFVATICHEVRTPLVGVFGCLDEYQTTLRSLNELYSHHKGSLPAEVKETMLSLMESMKDTNLNLKMCSRQQKAVLDDMLDLSKLEATKLQLCNIPFDLKETVMHVIQAYKSQAEKKNLSLLHQISFDTLPVKGDPHRLSQVLINLLLNAIKFTNEGEIMLIVEHKCKLNDTEIHVILRDTGIGMTVEEQQKLFDRFSQANQNIANQFGGTGLGLAISQHLVELMGGKLSCKSEKMKGTQFEFTISLPNLSSEERIEFTTDLPTNGFILPPTKSVLIVEDNIMNQQLLKRYVKDFNLQCSTASNGYEAVNMVKQNHYDFIFMDLQMPVKNGLEATREIRQWEIQNERKRTPIVGLSGNASVEYMTRAHEAGMDNYLTKPYFRKNVYAVLAVHLATRDGKNES